MARGRKDTLCFAKRGNSLKVVSTPPVLAANNIKEVIMTSLESHSALLIRYVTSDITQQVETGNDDSPCGMRLGRLVELQGRSHDLIVGPKGQAM